MPSAGLRGELQAALDRIRALEGQTPQAGRLQLEATRPRPTLPNPDTTGTRRGCRCSYCACDEDEPEESPLARRDACIGTWSGQGR
jgi:hypothetical protein